MNLSDLTGLAVIAFILFAGLYALYRISKPVSYTKEEYEERMKKGSGIARGAMNALCLSRAFYYSRLSPSLLRRPRLPQIGLTPI